ncbi:uncharacterized protein LOC133186424 isoform X1 [Saccostrea echinata]|uniref:uncharacterized protein LOC133186424 isoform X1 n=1 Tax=Saccostrea echinata TaxID=191078 RepID=UPI002A81EC11|nr:uncharacterized protein LOC133186424 isoform X1 [Saccostrea echinata]
MSSESVVLVCCFGCLLLPGLVLQTTGFFSPYWIKQNSTTDCFRGIFLTVNCEDTIKGLGTTVFGLQATALVIIALTTGVIMYSICCNKDGVGDVGCCTKCGVCVLCLYPAAGIIGFAGCMLVIKDYKDHEKGWSFYLSLATSCYVMLKSLVFCCATYKYAKTEKGTDNKDGKVNKSYVGNEVVQYGESGSSQDNRAMATSGDGGLILGHVQEHHHLEISRSGSIMIRKLQIARVFHIR